ncbi:MAG: phenylalanine--tRNA ligase subunit beta [Myxococcota bacterium]|jgi:phenylalanyl-tRNA synthetase beta chain
MKASFEWLKEYVDAGDVAAVATSLTMAGLEVEAIFNPYAAYDRVFVARIAAMRAHPGADSLKLCDLDLGGGRTVTVVCGATNVFEGAYVPWMEPGSKTSSGRTVEAATIRGAVSEGMLAAREDLGLEEKSTGIWILPAGVKPGTSIAAAFGHDAEELDVNVTPNRPDCLCHIGIAREIGATTGKALKMPVPEFMEGGAAASGLVSIEIRDSAGCPRYLARIVKDVKIAASPDWMARRLMAAGVRPINIVVDATNYVMLELGHPMHAFDLAKVRGAKIIVRRAEAGEKLVTIDGVERTLIPSDLVIADGAGPVAIAGVMGGGQSGISDATTDILLECAYFEPRGIRKTSTRLGLGSESSYRFERGVNPGGLELALDRCAELIAKFAGGKVLPGRVGAGDPPDRAVVKLRPSSLSKVAGTQIPGERAVAILLSLGFEAAGSDGAAMLFRVPSWRPDVSIEEDLIEEVIRIFGYDNIPPSLPTAGEFAEALREPRHADTLIRRAMTALGFQEAINYSFVGAGASGDLGIKDAPLPIRNPLSEDQAVMRLTLLHGLLSNARHNVRRQARSLRLFEIGRVFAPSEGGSPLPAERLRVAALICGRRNERTWACPDEPADFYDILGAAERLMEELRVVPAFSRDGVPPHLHPGRSASILIDGKTAGSVGEIHPKIAGLYDLPSGAFVFEMDASAITGNLMSDPVYKRFGDFPSVERDIAVVVEDSVEAGRMIGVVRGLGIPEVLDVRVFDVYTGAQVGEGRKNVAISVTYRASDRTLKDDEVTAMHSRIVDTLNSRFAAVLRG